MNESGRRPLLRARLVALAAAQFVLFAAAAFPQPSWAQTVPSPSPAPSAAPSSAASPEPSPTPAPGTITLSADLHTTVISTGASGPGVQPPEAAAFAAGSPLSPLTPYDTLTSAPLVSGNADETALILKPTYHARGFDLGLTAGAGLVTGSITNGLYWGESLFPQINPHLGIRSLPYRVVFPMHAGGDDGSALVASVLSGSIATKDGAFALRGGWFDLAQTLPFVFVQPALQNATPSLGMVTPETLGDAPPALASWGSSAQFLPLHGADLVATRGIFTLELTDAALPSLPATGARITSASLVSDRGEGTRFGLEVAHVVTGGEPVGTTVLFGGNPAILVSPQGNLPTSTVGGQRQTIVGASGAFHVVHGLDAIVEAGDSTYDADGIAQPGTARPGTYLHAGLNRLLGAATLSLDVYRNDPYYATTILPYGIPENVWSVAWSWPGQWLKSNYQLISNAPANVDRQGYRLKYTYGGADRPLDVRASYATFGEIAPITIENALRAGFVDGFFLPQANAAATLGRQRQVLFYAAWRPPFAELRLDYADDAMHRNAAAAHGTDLVSYDSPEIVLSAFRHIGRSVLASFGLARYAMRGSFGQPYTNIDFSQRSALAGLEIAETPHATLLVTLRRAAFSGIPSQPGGPSPDFTATQLIVEQRYRR